MEKSGAIELLEHLAWDRDIERNPYGDALNIAIEALKAQLSCEGTTSDLISRQAAIDAVKAYLGDYEISRTVQCRLRLLPTVQPELAIPLSWIDKYTEWLHSLSNVLADQAEAHISVMLEKWRDEQNG